MKRARILLVLTAVLLAAAWATATIEIQTTTPRVNPDGMCEVAGTFRMIFSAPEFGNPNQAADPAYYVLVRVQLSQGVQLMNIGGRTKPQITPASFIALALEKDSGNPSFPTDDPDAVRIVRFESGTAADYFDILFTKNMYHATWSLSGSDRVRITLGTPAGDDADRRRQQLRRRAGGGHPGRHPAVLQLRRDHSGLRLRRLLARGHDRRKLRRQRHASAPPTA